MKNTTYFVEITSQKAEVSVWERKTRIHFLDGLFATCQLRNFPCEFTENCFAAFDQSSCAIYLMWYRLLLFFLEFTSIILFMVWFQDSEVNSNFFKKNCWKHDTSLQSLGIHDSSAFYSTLLSFFVLEIFGFSWTSLFARYFGSISRFVQFF